MDEKPNPGEQIDEQGIKYKWVDSDFEPPGYWQRIDIPSVRVRQLADGQWRMTDTERNLSQQIGGHNDRANAFIYASWVGTDDERLLRS